MSTIVYFFVFFSFLPLFWVCVHVCMVVWCQTEENFKLLSASIAAKYDHVPHEPPPPQSGLKAGYIITNMHTHAEHQQVQKDKTGTDIKHRSDG